MSTLDDQALHEEYQAAECEHAIWLEDIGRWRSEHRRAAAMLAQAQAALLEQDAALESHAETVRSHELQVQRHERAAALPQLDNNDRVHDLSEDPHHEYQAQHDRAREAHQRINQHHDMITTEVRHLTEKLLAPM